MLNGYFRCFKTNSMLSNGFIEWKHLSHYADTFTGAIAEQDTHTRPNILRMSDKLKHYGGTVIGANLITAHNTANNRRLSNTSNVHRRLEANINGSCMKQYRNFRLKYVNLSLYYLSKCNRKVVNQQRTWKKSVPQGGSSSRLLPLFANNTMPLRRAGNICCG